MKSKINILLVFLGIIVALILGYFLSTNSDVTEGNAKYILNKEMSNEDLKIYEEFAMKEISRYIYENDVNSNNLVIRFSTNGNLVKGNFLTTPYRSYVIKGNKLIVDTGSGNLITDLPDCSIVEHGGDPNDPFSFPSFWHLSDGETTELDNVTSIGFD